MTGIFDDVSSITIGNKEVASIEIEGGVIWEKESPTPTITITCKKSDSGNISLLTNVQITLNGETKRTDSEGVVSFENVPDGTQEITADTGSSVRTQNITIDNQNPIMEYTFNW